MDSTASLRGNASFQWPPVDEHDREFRENAPESAAATERAGRVQNTVGPVPLSWSECTTAIGGNATLEKRKSGPHALPAAPARRADLRMAKARPASLRRGLSHDQALAALALIANRLESNVSTKELAQVCHISRGHFSRAFKITFGQTPHRFVLLRRLELACQLLSEPSNALADVAIRCGFSDQPHFTRTFKCLTFQTPQAWRAAGNKTRKGPAPIVQEIQKIQA